MKNLLICGCKEDFLNHHTLMPTPRAFSPIFSFWRWMSVNKNQKITSHWLKEHNENEAIFCFILAILFVSLILLLRSTYLISLLFLLLHLLGYFVLCENKTNSWTLWKSINCFWYSFIQGYNDAVAFLQTIWIINRMFFC